MKLSEKLAQHRAESPDKDTPDGFIRDARQLEETFTEPVQAGDIVWPPLIFHNLGGFFIFNQKNA